MAHYHDVTMGTMASQITSLTIVNSSVYSGADQRKHQSSASLAFVRGIHRRPVNSPHKGPVTRKMFLFDDVIMWCVWTGSRCHVDVFWVITKYLTDVISTVLSGRISKSSEPYSAKKTKKDYHDVDGIMNERDNRKLCPNQLISDLWAHANQLLLCND